MAEASVPQFQGFVFKHVVDGCRRWSVGIGVVRRNPYVVSVRSTNGGTGNSFTGGVIYDRVRGIIDIAKYNFIVTFNERVNGD